MLDAGADITIISSRDWPKNWPTINIGAALAGIGGATTTCQSIMPVQIVNPEGQVATVRPYVVAVPLNLWG